MHEIHESLALLVGKSCKSWALALEYLESVKDRNCHVRLIKVDKLQFGLPISNKRKKFEKKYLKKFPNLEVYVLSWKITDIFLLYKMIRSRELKHKDNLTSRLEENEKWHLFHAELAAKYEKLNTFLDSLVWNKHWRFITFNGREILPSSFLKFAMHKNYETRILERASSSNKYEVYNLSPHTNNEWWDKLDKFHINVEPTNEMINRAITYLNFKSEGLDPFQKIKWSKYFDAAETIDLQENRYIVFYSVSTGEVTPFKKFQSNCGYSSQFAALDDLIRIAQKHELHVIIRRHPNSIGLDSVDREELLWSRFRARKNVTYIGPKSRVDSYTLAKNALAAFTWRSTIGLELQWLGIPTFAMGPAKWAINKKQLAYNQLEIEERLENLEPPDLYYPLKFAVYISNFGIATNLFQNIERWGVILDYDEKIINQSFYRFFAKIRFFLTHT